MTNKKYTEQEKVELDGFLLEEYYQKIYNELTDKSTDYFELFEPLFFIQLVKEKIVFVEENKEKPLFIIRNLQNEPLNKGQFDYLRDCLLNYFENRKETDERLKAFCDKIAKTTKEFGFDCDFEINLLDYYLDEYVYSEMGFGEISEHLDTLPTNKEKINYLLDTATTLKQNHNPLISQTKPTLAEKCELQIENLQRKESLGINENTPENGLDELSLVKRIHNGKELKTHKDLTTDRAILFMHYLLKKTGTNNNSNTAKAEAIFFLTGLDAEAVRQRMSSVFSKNAKQPSTTKKDLRIVRNLFDKLGLHELVKEIDTELNIS